MLKSFAKAGFSRKVAPRAAASWPLFALIYFGCYWLRFEGDLNGPELRVFLSTFVWVACLKVAAFAYFQVYQGWGRYVTFHDLTLLLKAATASSFAILLVDFLLFPAASTPRSVFLMDWGLTIVAIGGLRSLARLLDERESFAVVLQRHDAGLDCGRQRFGRGPAARDPAESAAGLPRRGLHCRRCESRGFADWRRPRDRLPGRHLPAGHPVQHLRRLHHRRRVVRPAGPPVGG